MRAVTSILAAALGLSLCGPGAARPAPQAAAPPAAEEPRDGAVLARPAGDPDWLEKILAREAEPLAERPLASEDGRFQARVAAEIVTPPELIDGDYYVQLNFGSTSPMECWIYPEGHDMAASHRLFSAQIFSLLAKERGEVEMKAVQRIDAGVFGAHPYLALDWLYRLKSPSGPLAGQIQHLSAQKGEASVHCLVTEPGYSETFERVFRGLVDRLELAGTPAEPYYQEVVVVQVRDLKVGVGRTRLTRDGDGDTKSVEQVSLLLPVDQQTLAASDTYHVQYSSADGRLINEAMVAAENGELTTQLKLDPTAGGGWRVSGTFKSKELESAIEPRELLSIHGQMLQLRGFLASAQAGDRTSFWEWSAEADPSALIEVGVVVKERTDDGVAAHLDLGPLQMEAMLDANGSVRSGTLDMGAIGMELRRVYVAGALPSP